MSYRYDDRSDVEQLHTRQIGEPLLARTQPQQAFEELTRTGAEIAQQIERVRWLMQREPMLEGRDVALRDS